MVWGYVGYKIYKALQGDDEISFDRSGASIKKIEPEQKENTIMLLLDYQDPFLKNGTFSGEHSTARTTSGTKTEKPKVLVPKQAVTPPLVQPAADIKYLGLVKNSEKNTETAMLSVNGRPLLVKQYDVIEGYTIKMIYRDSIIAIKGKKERLTIKR